MKPAPMAGTLPAPLAEPQRVYHAAIVGGGLGGLTLSIQLAREGFNVVLVEKEYYPFHRVCGEYISFECWNFLESLGYPLSDMDLPMIKQLQVSAPNGNLLGHTLPLGGFGISRYKIDAELAQLARSHGVDILEGQKVKEVRFNGNLFQVDCGGFELQARQVVAAHGKRSNIDIKWQRPFVLEKNRKLNNFIGVKYHVAFDQPADTIALHNFEDGYCGISQVEEKKYCLCYLTRASNLAKSGNSIERMEKNILCRNPVLKDIFSRAVFLRSEPVTISQISFAKKTQVERHVLLIGDAAGLIAPLCGNGMSMAMHAGKLAAGLMIEFLRGSISRSEMETRYIREWNKLFAGRLRMGRAIQAMFGRASMSNAFIGILKKFPALTNRLIRQIHGEPF